MIGRVYKIIVNCSNECYVGSTIQECRARWQEHKNNYSKWKNGYKKCICSSFELFDKYDIENCKIILIKEYEVCDRTHLQAYEQIWINKLKPINRSNPFQIKKLSMKLYNKKQVEKNPNYHKEQREKFLENHLNYEKERYYKRKTKNPNLGKERYQKHKEEILQKSKEKITCECGVEITNIHLSRHKRTKKHQELLQQIRPVQ